MRAPLSFAIVLILGGCWQVPSDNVAPGEPIVAAIEAKLAGHPCIGDLDEWERNYRYSRKSGLLTPYSLNPDLDVVEFHLRRAGTWKILPGRKVVPARAGGDWPDSAAVAVVEGRYGINSASLSLSRCEHKFG